MLLCRVLIIVSSFFMVVWGADSLLEIPTINSVKEIDLSEIGPHTVFVFDADETIAQVDYMLLNWENERQHEAAIMKVAITFYESFGNTYNPNNLHAFRAFFEPLYETFESAPLAYSHTEEAWVSFLDGVRATGAKTIVVSSRRFFEEGRVPEAARIKFFEDLGFEREHLLYAEGAKDKTIHEWLVDKLEISSIVFVDNLHDHCVEVAKSVLLKSYKCSTFIHNAYKNYFEMHHAPILSAQLRAAHREKRRVTDTEALAMAGK